MLFGLILIPILGALIAPLIPDNRQRPLILPLVAVIHTALCVDLLRATPPPAYNGWIWLDPIGKILLLPGSILFLFCALYAVGYLAYRQERSNRSLCSCLLICLAAMSLVSISQHLGLLWIAIESTTLTMAPLIYFNRNARSVEATWKYILICSVGIALALLGLYFLAYATIVARQEPTLLLPTLLTQAKNLSPAWLGGAFVFLLVGFGTKVGLAPLHTWKPDAYGEAPGLVGALLAGGLVNCGLVGIIRIYQISNAAGAAKFCQDALIAMGILSMVVAAIFSVRQADFKRLLAYSSVEHVGLIAAALGLGKGALYGALLHMINNSLTKGVMFLASGNIHRSYNSKRTEQVRGAIARLPWSGGLFLAGFFAITGSPPFAPFVSEFSIISSAFAQGRHLIGSAMLVLLAAIFIGMALTVMPIVSGRPHHNQQHTPYRDTLMTVGPPLALLALVVLLGVWVPEQLHRLLQDATRLLEVRQ